MELEWNNAEALSGALSFKFSPMVLDFNTNEDILLSMVTSAYHKHSATYSSTFIVDAPCSLFFVLYLVCLFVHQLSVYLRLRPFYVDDQQSLSRRLFYVDQLYQWLFYVNQLLLYKWLFCLFVLFAVAVTLVFLYFHLKQRTTTTDSSAFTDAHVFLFFALYLVCIYVDKQLLYQWLLYVNQLPLYRWLFYLVVLFALAVLFLYFYVNYAPFLFLEEDIKWIRKEKRLLHAITKDADQVMHLTSSMEARKLEIWDSAGPFPCGASIEGLDGSQAAWVLEAKTAVKTAEQLVATFEKMTGDANTYKSLFAIISKFGQMENLFAQTKQAKKQINDTIGRTVGVNICKLLGRSLEFSRSSLRTLLDRPIQEQRKQADVKRRVASTIELITSILNSSVFTKGLEHCIGEPIYILNLQLLLLHPFLKEMEGIQFESAIEEAWVEEVEEIISEAHLAFHKFLRRSKGLYMWLPAIRKWREHSNWKKLTGDIRRINMGFEQLLERKDRYSFNFIRRESSRFVYQPPHKNMHEVLIPSVVAKMNYLKESFEFGEVYKAVTSLCSKLEIMHKLVSDAAIDEGWYNTRDVNLTRLEQLEKIVRSAEQSVETFKDSSAFWRKDSSAFWRNHVFKTRAANPAIKLCREADQINNIIDLYMRCIKSFGLESREESSSVIGLEEDIDALVSQLTTDDGPCSVISIVGIGGIGKTTLAKKIYNHELVVKHFPARVWVPLPQKSYSDATVEEEVSNNVHDVLNKGRSLLVLDNISTTEQLDDLRAQYQADSSGCKILLTTRNTSLASQANSPLHKLRLRTREESWQLFTQMVHFPPKEKMLAKDILSKCWGLPLGILRVGYLLFGKGMRTAEELKMVLQFIMQKDTPLVETFTKRPREELPPNLFTCLSYFRLFPREFEIPSRRLITLWIAEQLVQVSEDKTDETEEDVAVQYLSELIDRGMIHVVKRRDNGEVQTCQIPYALQKLNLQDMSLERVTDHYNTNDRIFGHIHGENSRFPNQYTEIKAIFSFDTREGNKPGEDIGNFLRKGIAGGFLSKLKVLDLERIFRPELPNTIGRLRTLRYLGLRWTYLESIPTTIGDLLNLQTLDVKHTYLHSLPGSIWKLQKLRHLYLNQSYRSKFMLQQGGGSLKNLQTLWGVFVDKDSPLKDGLDKLINLRKLGLTFQLDPLEQEPLTDGIVKLKHLQSLRLRSVDETGEPRQLVLKDMSGLDNLTSLTLFGKLNTSIIAAAFPENLTDLTLSASCLSDDPMLELEKLLNLKYLSFRSDSYMRNKMVCSTLGFPKLVVLKLWKLQHLEDWSVEEKAMQKLRVLEIRSCKKLNVPTGFKHLKALTELKLTDMPNQFAATLAGTRGQLFKDLNHSPEIITVNWEDSAD